MNLSPLKEGALSQITKKEIYRYIKNMDLDISNKLPREEILAEQLGVSRITVRSALNELASEGIIFRRQGKGTFVNREALQMKVSLNPIGDLRQVIIDCGYDVKIDVIRVTKRDASEQERNSLKLPPDSKVLVIEKIFYADNTPAIYSIDRISDNLFAEKIPEEELKKSIFELSAQKLGRKITWDKMELSTILNEDNEVLKNNFRMEKIKPFLNCEIINFDENDKPVVYSNEYIDTELIRFNLIRQKKF